MVNASLIRSVSEVPVSLLAKANEMDLGQVMRVGIQEAGQRGNAETDVKMMDLKKMNLQGMDTKCPCRSGSLPTITRTWSFMGLAEDRKPSLADVKANNLNLKIDVSRALERSWSFTKTTWSPNLLDGNPDIAELINPSKEDLAEGVLKASPPMVTIEESDDAAAATAVHPECKPDAKYSVPAGGQPVPQVLQNYKVKPTARSFVPALTPPEKPWLLLSNLDRVVNPTFSSVIHYYENAITEKQHFQDLTRILKESLAKTLVEFYPLAGRLELREDGKVDLHCNNKGAIWIEALIDANLKDIGGAKPNHLLSGFQTARMGSGPIYVPDQLKPMPVLLVQVTRFKCGTIAIATSWHHTVADGFSGMHFMRSWSEVALGKPISFMPIHARDVLKARDPPSPTVVNGYSTKDVDEDCCDDMPVNTSEEAKLETFDLDATAIADLKRQANLVPPSSPRPYTSAESISGHLWRQMTKARAAANSYDASLAKDQITKFFMFVDGRKRLKLPSGYFGNVVCSACAVAKEADILSNPLNYAASMIRTATSNITEEYFRSLVDWVELQGMSNSKSEHVNSLGHDVAATFWTFFPMYDIEFGWGRPVFAARNSPPRPRIDGIAMMPSNDGNGMTALLNLHSDRMSKLERQISFTTVFHN